MEAGPCNCDMDLEPVKICDIRRRRARKDHVCDECSSAIKKGATYVSLAVLWDDGWDHVRRCVPCHSIAGDYCCGVVGKGAVRDMVRELLGVDIVTGEVM